MRYLNSLLTIIILASGAGVQAKKLAHFPMDPSSQGEITEEIGGGRWKVGGVTGAEAAPGVKGSALYFDGYSTRVDASLALNEVNGKSLTASLWLAVPCYPIVEIDAQTKEKSTIASCIDEQGKKGFGFYLGMDGKVEFRVFVGGWNISVESSLPIATYEWQNLVGVLDADQRQLKLYINGEEVGTTRCNGTPDNFTLPLRLGHGTADRLSGPFNLMSFNGLLDELTIWNEVIPTAEIKTWKPDYEADLTVPTSRFEENIMRPRFHGMPGAGWTNESHGMTYSDGRYHVFFQKNANGPYMARLHWGHISSDNLYDWREEKIALAPGESYDFKGCWSGCVFSDEILTGGKPSVIYTAVDYARGVIAQADPVDASLSDWKKKVNNPIINGRPSGLSDDFRDPYFFRNGEKAYIIVGSSKNNVGTATLHRYENGRWSNDGATFFSGSNKSVAGRFWEMPNVTKMNNGKWLFTVTPLDMSGGVKTIYWTGDINSNGTFAPDAQSTMPRSVELMSKEGFGLLSPTIYQKDGKTIALGIVPDKLPGSLNYELGWAHCYSLPREWSIGSDGNLWQKPFEGLKGLRQGGGYARENFNLSGNVALDEVSGRQLEILGVMEAGASEFGYNVFEGSKGAVKVSINPATSRLKVDMRETERWINDGGVYDGLYECNIPGGIRQGEEVTLNLFVDGSVLDIFVNNRFATSIRVFPTDAASDKVSVFSNGTTKVKSLQAWKLKGKDLSGINEIVSGTPDAVKGHVFNTDGMLVRTGVKDLCELDDLPAGVYILDGKKIMVK